VAESNANPKRRHVLSILLMEIGLCVYDFKNVSNQEFMKKDDVCLIRATKRQLKRIQAHYL